MDKLSCQYLPIRDCFFKHIEEACFKLKICEEAWKPHARFVIASVIAKMFLLNAPDVFAKGKIGGACELSL